MRCPPRSGLPADHAQRNVTAAAAPADRTSVGISPASDLPSTHDAQAAVEPSIAAASVDAVNMCSVAHAATSSKASASADMPVSIPAEMSPQPSIQRCYRPKLTAERAWERRRARSITPPEKDDVHALAHQHHRQGQPNAATVSGGPAAETTASSLAAPASDPGPLKRGLDSPCAAPVTHSEPRKRPCKDVEQWPGGADVSPTRGAATPERTHVSETPAHALGTAAKQFGASDTSCNASGSPLAVMTAKSRHWSNHAWTNVMKANQMRRHWLRDGAKQLFDHAQGP